METRLPRRGTRIREALERWVTEYDGEVTFTQFQDMVSGTRRYGQWPTHLLKRYGRKLGPPGGRSKWVIDGSVASRIANGLLRADEEERRRRETRDRFLEFVRSLSPLPTTLMAAADLEPAPPRDKTPWHLEVGGQARFFFPDTPDHPAQGVLVTLTEKSNRLWNGTYAEEIRDFNNVPDWTVRIGDPWYGLEEKDLVSPDTDVRALIQGHS